MQPSHTSTLSGVGPYRTRLERVGIDPSLLLRGLAGGPRGFRSDRDGWTVWGGALDRIEVASGTPDRFGVVRDRIAALLGRTPGGTPTGEAAAVRLFGGFSFLDEGTADPVWSGFPAAAFVLPRIVVEARGDRVRAFSAGGREELQALLDGATPGAAVSRFGDRGRSVAQDGAGSERGSPTGLDREIESGDEARSAWSEAVGGILRAIEEGELRKAVLARFHDLHLAAPVDPVTALDFLRAENRRAHVFLLELEPGRIFLGAAPELLARLREGRFEATAVAGSMRRSPDPRVDRERIARLLESAKDRAEHALTAEDMVEVLEGPLATMEVERDPRVLTLARIHHLETTLSGEIRPGQDILSLVQALHPTPAVCGRPRDAALARIRAAEPFDRGWYAGPVGWLDGRGEGEFVPALRTAVGGGREWRLFAGAGIVRGSDPELEWEETALKFEPALRALRVGTDEPAGDD